MAFSTSPPSSPQSRLYVGALARILVWNTRRRLAATPETTGPQGAEDGASGSPCPQKRAKPHHIECSSGSELKTHGLLMDSNPQCRKSDVIVHRDVYVCLNGVDTARLLLLSRRRVFQKVELLGGNAIIDERWSCTICKHRTRRGDVYKASIVYEGTPARCSLADPQKPVAMTQAVGVPGLMTVVSRE